MLSHKNSSEINVKPSRILKCELELNFWTNIQSEWNTLKRSEFFFEFEEIKSFDFCVPNLAVDYVHHLIIFQFWVSSLVSFFIGDFEKIWLAS